MRDSFIMYTENAEQISMLTDEQAGTLFKAIMLYQLGEDLPEMDGMVSIVFSVIRQKLDRDSAKYEEVCEKRKEAGRKTKKANADSEGAKKANASTKEAKEANAFSEQAKQANAFSEKQKKQMHPDNDNDPDNDPDNDNDNEPEKDIKPLTRTSAQGVTASQMVLDAHFAPETEKAVLDWIKYKTEKRQGYKETGLKSLLTVLQRQIDLHGNAAVIQCIEDSMAAGYQGITWGLIKEKPKEEKSRYDEIREWFTEDAG